MQSSLYGVKPALPTAGWGRVGGTHAPGMRPSARSRATPQPARPHLTGFGWAVHRLSCRRRVRLVAAVAVRAFYVPRLVRQLLLATPSRNLFLSGGAVLPVTVCAGSTNTPIPIGIGASVSQPGHPVTFAGEGWPGLVALSITPRSGGRQVGVPR